MDATQMISDSVLESEEEENEDKNGSERGEPMAKLCILKNEHIPEAEFPLFLGDNVLGRDRNTCTLHLPASSVSKRHATISLSIYRQRGQDSEVEIEALIWDLGSMNGTRKGYLKLTPNVRYALSEGDSLVVADIPCQYASCSVDSFSCHRDTSSPMGTNSGVKARLPYASGVKGGDASRDSKQCVDEGPAAIVLSEKTAVKASCLSFEQTPSQPQGTLVPESDSDSDSERGGRRDGRYKALEYDSHSHKSSPNSSIFLSPTNVTVPESEDESPITSSSSPKNRSYRPDGFTAEGTDVDVEKLETKTVHAVVDSEEKEERILKQSGQLDPEKQKSTVTVKGDHALSVFTPSASTDANPASHMDIDTDVEEAASVGPVNVNKNEQVDQPPSLLHFHLDSDTDVDEDEDASLKAPKMLPSSDENRGLPCVIPVVQPDTITMDSDTDVDDESALVSDASTHEKPASLQTARTAESASSRQLKDFHLDSGTDVDMEEEQGSETNNEKCKMDETLNKLEVKFMVPETTPAAPHNLHLDSDTDDEALPAVSEPAVTADVAESRSTAPPRADLDILSDSDTDVEDESRLIKPVPVATLTVCPGTKSEAMKVESDGDTDVDEPIMPPPGDGANQGDLRDDSDTDLEEEPGEGQVPSMQREGTSGMLASLLQNCSTPVQEPGGEVEEMETQAFTCPSPGAHVPAVIPAALSSFSDSQEEEDFVVAETQSFIPHTQECQSSSDPIQPFILASPLVSKSDQFAYGESSQLGLSERCSDQALAMESTQAFVSVRGGIELEATQAYAATSATDRMTMENDLNLDATQPYVQDQEPARCSLVSEKEGQLDLALEATQAYISEPCNDPEDNTDDDETQPSDLPTCSTMAEAETQSIPSCVEEEKAKDPVSSIQQNELGTENEKENEEQHEKAAQPQEKPLKVESKTETHTSSNEETDEDSFPGSRKKETQLHVEESTQRDSNSELSVAETQPMATCQDEEEELMPGPQKRKVKQLHLEEEVTQELTNSALSVTEAQPIATSEDDDDEDFIQGRRKRKAKQLHLEEEQTQSLTCSEVSLTETQPMDVDVGNESGDEDLMPVPQKRKAKRLHLKEEKTQELSVAETQSMATSEDDDEDSMPGPRKRKAKQLHLKEEETQHLTNSAPSVAETQPVATMEDDEEDLMLSTRKRKAKQLHLEEEATQELTNAALSVAETQPTSTCKDDEDDSVSDPPKRKQSPLPFEEEKTQALLSIDLEIQKTETSENDQSEVKDLIPYRQKRKEESLQPEEEEVAESAVSVVENQLIKTETDVPPQKGKRRQAGTNGASFQNLREGEEQAGCSLLLKRQTRAGSKTPSTRRKRGLDDDKEDEVIQAKQAREKKITRQQRNDNDEAQEDKIETERNEDGVSKRAIKEQEKEKDATELRRQEGDKSKEKSDIEEGEKGQEDIVTQCRRDEGKHVRNRQKNKQEILQAEGTVETSKESLQREEKEKVEMAKRGLEEGLARERKEQASGEKKVKERGTMGTEIKGKQLQEPKKAEDELKTPMRGRRGARRTVTSQDKTEPKQDSSISTSDDFPARRLRSRSNSVSSEKSTPSVNQEGTGRGRGRAVRKTSETPRTPAVKGSHRHATMAAIPTEKDSTDTCAQELLSQSNSSNSLNSDISSCSGNYQNRGRGRQRGMGRKTGPEPDLVTSASNQSNRNLTSKPTPRGRKSRRGEDSPSEVSHEASQQTADFQQPSSSRGRQQVEANNSEPVSASEEDQSQQKEGYATEESLMPKRNIRGRSQKELKSETGEGPATAVVSGSNVGKGKRTRGKTQLANAGAGCSSSNSPSKRRASKNKAAEETKDEIPKQGKGRDKASSMQAKRNAKETPTEVKDESEKMEVETLEKRAKGRPSVIPKKKKEPLQESETSSNSMDQDADVEQPQTPISISRKRRAPADSSPATKTPLSSSASPAARGRLRAASQVYKVLFTGVMDETGEKVLTRLGGSMAKGVADMNCLVTDKVRRTVKFLCAVAKGVPIVTPDWLEKSGKAGSFLSPNAFIVKDPDQEKKFNFCLQGTLRTASSQPLLQGYEIHVTKSVKPEPIHMKDIISSSGATFLPKMPSTHKPQTVVISCEKDWSLCGPALSASVPIVTTEFILTGVLQQKVDFKTHVLSLPTANLQPTSAGRERGRRRT
ncbi:mediator of DNA damage checkpoint protein 1 [Pholidichthys leucotaenia]